jgi:NitT/TauT family transport system substrate-binding protein
MGTLNRIYRQTGMKETDIERVYMGFPQQIVALQNGAADVAFPTEPFASEAVRRGFAVAFMTDDEIYPDHQMSVMLYGDAFRLKRKDVALRFMRGYLRGVRAQNESIINGKLAGRDAEEFVSLIAENTNVKDKDFLRTVTMSYTASDGRPNVDSLREDFEVFRAAGLIEGEITLEEALDLWFAETASTQLDKTAAPK